MIRTAFFLTIISVLLTGCFSSATKKESKDVSFSNLNSTPMEEVENRFKNFSEEDFIVEDSGFTNSERTIASTELPNEKVVSNYYTVKENDTLMLIAWKIYGDYSKWKDLREHNIEKFKKDNSVSKGDQLYYLPPEFHFKRLTEGSPYLIRRGDTLGKISYSA